MTRARTFAADRQSVPDARRFASQALADSPREVREAVELMVSELATNCIRHVNTAFRVSIRRVQGELRVEVTDHGGGVPAMRSPGPDDPTGRGLRIVDMLSDRWGVADPGAGGKTVWFTLTCTTEKATGATGLSCMGGGRGSPRPA